MQQLNGSYDQSGLMRNVSGFTWFEGMACIVVLIVATLGLVSSVNSLSSYERISEKMAQATQSASRKLDEIKSLGKSEQIENSRGFSYLVTPTNYLKRLTQVDPWNYSGLDRDGDILREWTLQTYPSGGSHPSFAQPEKVEMVEATVTTRWTDENSQARSVTLKTLLHRRRIVDIYEAELALPNGL
ncbi:MAG: hypothetical protein ACE5EK_10825 [Nitrospinales bacterium]